MGISSDDSLNWARSYLYTGVNLRNTGCLQIFAAGEGWNILLDFGRPDWENDTFVPKCVNN